MGGVVLGILHFYRKKRGFRSRSDDYPRFFGHFSLRALSDLSKTSLKSILVAGKVYMSSNRRAFQAQLAPRDPKVAHLDPQETPGEFLKIICIFLKFFKNFDFFSNPSWEGLGGVLGVWSGLGEQFGLKSLSIR